jgi:hypothetical protein
MAMPMGVSVGKEPPASILALRESLGDPRVLITVGDVVTGNVARLWRIPDLAIIDLRTRRSEYVGNSESNFDAVIRVRNPPGTLSDEVIRLVENAVALALGGSRVLVRVDGEEDLLAIPAVLKAPRGSLLLYGLYTGYLVAIPINDDYRLGMLKLMSMMQIRG